MKSSGGSRRGWAARFSSRKSARWFGTRLVPVGGGQAPFQQQVTEDTQVTFCDNRIKSSKYNLLTFLFINLFEQFRRVANFYFLLVAVIQLGLPEPPVSPFTSVAPLVFVVIVTMIKQGYEDILRHRADRAINTAEVQVLKSGLVGTAQSQNITVGDIVMVRKGEVFPADLVLLASSTSNGKCFVMTANLDGETNLKPLMASRETRHCTTPEMLANLSAQVECEQPSPDLHNFNGRLKVKAGDGSMVPGSLSLDNIGLRGTQLRNTDFVYGCAVYTGRDTRMSQNSKSGKNKFSTVELTMNKVLVVYIIILILEIVLCTTLKYRFGVLHGYDSFTPETRATHWYIGDFIKISPGLVFEEFFSFLVVFNNIVPISLYVTLELQKFLGSLFLAWDRDLYDPEDDEPARCNSSDLNEELGQVEILFSDKTGTLTENIMIFKEASIGGKQYPSGALAEKPRSGFSSFANDKEGGEEQGGAGEGRDPVEEEKVAEFLTALAVCHTVQVAAPEEPESLGQSNPGYVGESDSPDGGGLSSLENRDRQKELEYNAASPDEKALVEACGSFGVQFLGEEEGEAALACRVLDSRSGHRPQIKVFTKLHVLEFDSTRKRMSVVVRYPCGRVFIVTKGAETSVLPLCVGGDIEETSLHIDEYALVGLRTLAVAIRELEAGELERFGEDLARAQQALEAREEGIQAVYRGVERDYTLLGATAVEDKLQEGVRDTLVSLGQAGVAVWILTGDKKETAINISYSCGHLQFGMTVLDVTGLTAVTVTRRLEEFGDQVNTMEQEFGLVVDGAALTLIMPLQENRELLYQVASRCQAVVCCRMSPLQKSEIVRMMKNSPNKPITAAIGDGGNDVAMIQEAHVGLGLMGKEGRAAVRSADFAFAKFRFLKKVILVHGHWYYYRVALLVQYFFYKNVACFAGQLFYCFYNNFSIQTLYDSFNLTFYNIFWTSAPIFVFALLEQNLPKKSLLKHPMFYRRIRGNMMMRKREFLLWFLYGVWHAVVVFFGWLLFWSSGPGLTTNTTSTQQLGQFSFGLCIYSTVVVLVNLKLWFQARSWRPGLILIILLSILGYIGINLGLQTVQINTGLFNLFGDTYNTDIQATAPINPDIFYAYVHVLSSPAVWLYTLLTLVAGLLPDVVIRVLRKHWSVIMLGAKEARREVEKKAKRGSYELKGIQSSGYREHRDTTVVGRRLVRRGLSFFHEGQEARSTRRGE